MPTKAQIRTRQINLLIGFRDTAIETRDGFSELDKVKYKQQIDDLEGEIKDLNDQIHKLSTGQVNAWGL